eukprot:101516_1
MHSEHKDQATIRKQRIERYKALRAKVKAQSQRSKYQNENHYKLTAKKTKTAKRTVNKSKLTSKQQTKAPKRSKRPKTIPNTKNNSESDNKPLHSSNKSTKPYYLRKNDIESVNQTEYVSVNAYQKRKYTELLTISQRTEWEYQNKYMSKQYGVDNYSSILRNININYDNIIIPICLEMLLILHESYNERIQIISTITNQLCDSSISNDQFALKMCKFLYSIGTQFADSRFLVIHAMKTQIQRLINNKPEQFCFFAPYLLKQISQTWSGIYLVISFTRQLEHFEMK